MSLWDYIVTDTSKTQTFDEAQANYDRLQSQLAAQGKANNAGPLIDPGTAAGSAFLNSVTFGTLGDAGNQPDGDNSSGVGALLKDVLILAAIAGAIYLFVELGGIQKLKRLAS